MAPHCVAAVNRPTSPIAAYFEISSIAPQLHIVYESSCNATGKENFKIFLIVGDRLFLWKSFCVREIRLMIMPFAMHKTSCDESKPSKAPYTSMKWVSGKLTTNNTKLEIMVFIPSGLKAL